MKKWIIAIGALLGTIAAILWQVSKHRGNTKASHNLAVHEAAVHITADVKEWEADVEKRSKEITTAIENGRKEEILRKWKEKFGDR
ncbi:unnamed protein product [marine sediment metagenome]|uniref:Uncharacterized protein n=1 Tax=marine sediment metagenome TaxID=412755 RepID=X0WKP0_9ZZZZ